MLVTAALAGCDRPVTAEDVSAALAQAVDSGPAPGRLPPERWALLRQVYRTRQYQPLWSGMERPLARGRDLLLALCNAELQGLRAGDFDLAGLRDALAQAYGPEVQPESLPPALARLDLALSAAFLRFGAQIHSGRLDPAAVDTSWFIHQRRTGLDSALAHALTQDDFGAMVNTLIPRRPQYVELLTALEQYRQYQEAGGWDSVPVPPKVKIRPGQDDALVPWIRRRLAITGELADTAAPAPLHYDSTLAGAVARFQETHGLEMDSTIGRATLLAMNIPVEDRVAQIELNLERYRWLPDDFGPRYVLVNIPDYQLHAFDGGEEVLTMRVVVGKDYDNPTPVFADSMSYLVFRPYWNVPSRILKEEIIPAARADSTYITAHDYEILRGNRVVPPDSIDWPRVDTAKLNFRVRQKPGNLNSLGLVKFMFPNQFDVYLHDTPVRSLFRRAGRAASHGCIRVEKPVELAQYALSRNADWDLKKIREAMRVDTTQTVNLKEKIPVYIVYFTAFVRDGQVRFRPDLYGTDRRGIALLRATTPAARQDSLCQELMRLAGAP